MPFNEHSIFTIQVNAKHGLREQIMKGNEKYSFEITLN